MKDFPVNVFPDVERDAFKKFSKKNVTEDYIKENLRRKGWECFSPFTDTGLDILATKEVNGRTIYRYIQVKTRSLIKSKSGSKDVFGYTLRSKDFETECRKFFFLYCDTVDDVLIIPMYDYLKICKENYGIGATHFAVPSFRNNNNKLNQLVCDKGEGGNRWTWTYQSSDGQPGGTFDFSDYLNEKGLEKMDMSIWDEETISKNREIAQMKIELFYRYRKTNSNQELFVGSTGQQIEDYLQSRSRVDAGSYISENKKIEADFIYHFPELYESHRKYMIDDMFAGGQKDD